MTADRNRTDGQDDSEPDDRERVQAYISSNDWRRRVEEAVRQRARVKAARHETGENGRNSRREGADSSAKLLADREIMRDTSGLQAHGVAEAPPRALGTVKQMRDARLRRDRAIAQRALARSHDDHEPAVEDARRYAGPASEHVPPRDRALAGGMAGLGLPGLSIRTLARFYAGVTAGFGVCVLAVAGFIAWDRVPKDVLRAPPVGGLGVTRLEWNAPRAQAPRPSPARNNGARAAVDPLAAPAPVRTLTGVPTSPFVPAELKAAPAQDMAGTVPVSTPVPPPMAEVARGVEPTPVRWTEPAKPNPGQADDAPLVDAAPPRPPIGPSAPALVPPAGNSDSAVGRLSIGLDLLPRAAPSLAVLAKATTSESAPSSRPAPAGPAARVGRAPVRPRAPELIAPDPDIVSAKLSVPSVDPPLFHSARSNPRPQRVAAILPPPADPPDPPPHRVAQIPTASDRPEPMRAMLTVSNGGVVDQARLDRLGLEAAQIQISPFAISATRIFYFHARDRAQAQRMARVLAGTAVSMTGIRPAPPPGRFDIQIAD